MEQVAQALKTAMESMDDENLDSVVETISSYTDDNGYYCIPEEIRSVLNAIISIYTPKAPEIQWMPWVTGLDDIIDSENCTWSHDITGERFEEMSLVKGKFPEYANKWADGIYGGSIFDSNGATFETVEGIRGIGYRALIAFDKLGNGAVFF